MKLAITGKGGVGKTTVSAGLAVLFERHGSRVVAVDADPDSNLAATLGFPEPDAMVPLFDQEELIEERTGARPGSTAPYFALNPRVDDIPEAYCPEHEGIRLLVVGGRNRKGGSGCFCPENALLRSLLSHLLFEREDVVILDMEAGVESLTRGTARGVDALLVVVEPGSRSLETAVRIRRLGADLGIARVWAVANKIREPADRQFIERGLDGIELVGCLPFRTEVLQSGMGQTGIRDALHAALGEPLQNVRTHLQQELARSA